MAVGIGAVLIIGGIAIYSGTVGYYNQPANTRNLGKTIESIGSDFKDKCSYLASEVQGWFSASKKTDNSNGKSQENVKSPDVNYPGNDATKAPEGYEWRGKPGSPQGSEDGAYYNPKTGESLRPAIDDPNHGPHWDYQQRGNPNQWRIYPDGRWELK